MPPSEALENFARTGATLVLHLAIRHIRRLSATLIEHYGADCPVVVGSQVSQPGELILRGRLGGICDQVEQAGLRQAAVIIVGWALEAEDFVESHLYSSRCRPEAPTPG